MSLLLQKRTPKEGERRQSGFRSFSAGEPGQIAQVPVYEYYHQGTVNTNKGWYPNNEYQKIVRPYLTGFLYYSGYFFSDFSLDALKGSIYDAEDFLFSRNFSDDFLYVTQEGLQDAKELVFQKSGSGQIDMSAFGQPEDLLMLGGILKSIASRSFEFAGQKILGAAQETGTRGHAFISKLIAWRYALDPRVERVTLDLGYRKLTGNMALRYEPRADVGVFFKSGRITVFEVASKTDIEADLILRHRVFMNKNGLNGTIRVIQTAKKINKILPK